MNLTNENQELSAIEKERKDIEFKIYKYAVMQQEQEEHEQSKSKYISPYYISENSIKASQELFESGGLPVEGNPFEDTRNTSNSNYPTLDDIMSWDSTDWKDYSRALALKDIGNTKEECLKWLYDEQNINNPHYDDYSVHCSILYETSVPMLSYFDKQKDDTETEMEM